MIDFLKNKIGNDNEEEKTVYRGSPFKKYVSSDQSEIFKNNDGEVSEFYTNFEFEGTKYFIHTEGSDGELAFLHVEGTEDNNNPVHLRIPVDHDNDLGLDRRINYKSVTVAEAKKIVVGEIEQNPCAKDILKNGIYTDTKSSYLVTRTEKDQYSYWELMSFAHRVLPQKNGVFCAIPQSQVLEFLQEVEAGESIFDIVSFPAGNKTIFYLPSEEEYEKYARRFK